ncbi:MAG: hypothetical protein WEH44_04495 [Pirellulaceae bacterium]
MLAQRERHSSLVQIRLEIDGQALQVAQVGENSLILREPCQFSKSPAKIVIVVDGQKSEHPVFLHHGISLESCIVHFRNVQTAESQDQLSQEDLPF